MMRRFLLVGLISTFLVSCSFHSTDLSNGSFGYNQRGLNPDNWPLIPRTVERNAETENQLNQLLNRMSLQQKVGQLLQVNASSITPQEVKQYHIGSVLFAKEAHLGPDSPWTVEASLAAADRFWRASGTVENGAPAAPVLIAGDADLLAHQPMTSAVFPSDAGLGAANDTELMQQIGHSLASQALNSGLDWILAPQLHASSIDYDDKPLLNYAENPLLNGKLAASLIAGLQGQPDSSQFLAQGQVIATAGNLFAPAQTYTSPIATAQQSQWLQMHAAGVVAVIQSGVQVVEVPSDLWQNLTARDAHNLLTKVLKNSLGFDGFTLGALNVDGDDIACGQNSCAKGLNAGIDMFRVSENWQGLYLHLIQRVQRGEISLARLDQAVSRILRVKISAGLMAADMPSKRPFAAKLAQTEVNEHHRLARKAVRESLVLLKNNNQLLPLKPTSHVLLMTDYEGVRPELSSGQTSNQGVSRLGLSKQSIIDGIRDALESGGGQLQLSWQENSGQRPDVAIVIFGGPTSEQGKNPAGGLDPQSDTALAWLKKMQGAGIPTVSLVLSEQPVWANQQLNQSDAFIVGWLPGSQGAGAAELLFVDEKQNVQHDFSGRLSHSWPSSPDQNVQADDYDYVGLFPVGYGLSLESIYAVGPLNESAEEDKEAQQTTRYMFAGDPVPPWRFVLKDPQGDILMSNSHQSSRSGALDAEAQTDRAYNDTLLLAWQGESTFAIEGSTLDISNLTFGDMMFQIEYRVLAAEQISAKLALGCGEGCSVTMDVSETLQSVAGEEWQNAMVKLSCFASFGSNMQSVQTPFSLSSSAGLVMQIKEIKVVSNRDEGNCRF